MKVSSRLFSFAWLIAPVCALAFIVWTDFERTARVEYVTNTDREDAVVDVNSPTGYAAGKRWLILSCKTGERLQHCCKCTTAMP